MEFQEKLFLRFSYLYYNDIDIPAYYFAAVHFKMEDLVEQYVRETIEYRTDLTEDTIPTILRLNGVTGFDSSGKANKIVSR